MTSTPSPPPDDLLGRSPAMDRVRERLRRAAATDVSVLLTGETGTGKTLAARTLHGWSRRGESPFVHMNCAGIPASLFESELFGHERGAFTGAVARRRGMFEQAHRGTLFLDELGELPPEQQAKLLTALEEGKIRRVGAESVRSVDVRLVSATLEDPVEAAAKGALRADLLHRIGVIRIELPPLRERREDIVPFALHFLEELSRRHRLPRPAVPPDGRRHLVERPWPGNVRELMHLLEASLVLGAGAPLNEALLREASLSGSLDLPGPRDPGSSQARATDPPSAGRYTFLGTPDEERERIGEALARHRGNRTRAARELGMSRATLRNRIRKYGLG